MEFSQEPGESPDLLAALSIDERLEHGARPSLTTEDRMRIQMQGVVGRRPQMRPAPVPPFLARSLGPESEEESETEYSLPTPPGLEEAERYLRELEAQPRDRAKDDLFDDNQPDAEISL